MENEKIVESAEQSWRVTDRRSFLIKGAAVGAGAIGASRLLADPAAASPEGPHGGDVAILQFLAAAELLEADLWQQYNELGGDPGPEPAGGTGIGRTRRPSPSSTKTCPSTSTTTPTTSSATPTSSTRSWPGAQPGQPRPVPHPARQQRRRTADRPADQPDGTDVDTSCGRVTAARKNPDLGDTSACGPDLAVGGSPRFRATMTT